MLVGKLKARELAIADRSRSGAGEFLKRRASRLDLTIHATEEFISRVRPDSLVLEVVAGVKKRSETAILKNFGLFFAPVRELSTTAPRQQRDEHERGELPDHEFV